MAVSERFAIFSAAPDARRRETMGKETTTLGNSFVGATRYTNAFPVRRCRAAVFEKMETNGH